MIHENDYQQNPTRMAADPPIKEIAYQLGFDEQAYFDRVFKSVTGLTPMSYRKQIQPH